MSVLAFLVTELQTLSSETRRKYPEIRDAAEKSLSILRAAPEQATSDLANGPQAEELLRPVFMGCSTRNPKVVTIALSSLQRLVAMKAVPMSTVPHVVATLADCISQGVDVQLRILQTLLSLLTNFTGVHGPLLGDALLLCFKLQDSRIGAVSSTAMATLRQLVMFVFDKVVEADRVALHDHPIEHDSEETTLPDGSVVDLHPSARDAYSVFEDLCLLANAERPLFLKLEALPKTFSLELIESVLTNYHALFRERRELLLLCRHHLSPMLLKSLSDKHLFPLTLRATRVVFLLLKQFLRELETESEVFLTLLTKIISGEIDGNDTPRPHWMRVLAMEITRGLCSDADLVREIWDRFDAKKNGSRVFSSLITALKRLATEKPALLGVESQMFGLGIPSQSSLDLSATGYGLDVGMVAGMVASAASMVASIGSDTGLSVPGSSMKLQCIDQLDKADSPAIPETYIFLLALQSLVSLSEGFASISIPLYTTIVVQRPRAAGDAVIRAPPALDITSLPSEEPSTKQLVSIHGMMESAWPAMLAALSFFIATSLSNDLFVDVVTSIQSMANVAGVVGLSTPRDAFLTSLSKFAIPSGVVSSLNSWVDTPRPGGVLSVENLGLSALAGSPQHAPTLSDRNIVCLKVLVSSALFLAGSLGPSWFDVLETLQNAEYVLFTKAPARKGSTGPNNFGAGSKTRTPSGSLTPTSTSTALGGRPPLMADLDLESVQAIMSRIFDASKNLEDDAFGSFVSALCKLSAEMVGMQSIDRGIIIEESGEDAVFTLSPAPTTPRVGYAHRRRASGIQLSRSIRGGDYGITKLGWISQLNIHRLIYRDPSLAWNTVTGHLLSIIRNSQAPGPIRLQAAEVMDEILVIVPRNITAAGELQTQVQRRVLDVLAKQIIGETSKTSSSVMIDIRRCGLETLHQILQFSGHTLVVGWETIFEMLSSVCAAVPNDGPPPSELTDGGTLSPRPRPPPLWPASAKANSALIRVAFQSLTLVCDSVDALTPEHLRLCISTLGLFGRQSETNMALTAAESLLWGVSDSIQSKRKDVEKEPEYSALWMFLLLELLGLCSDSRPEVRNGAMQTLFRSLQLYGATLSPDTWTKCLDLVVFPLLESMSPSITQMSSTSPTSYASSSTQSPAQSWDETKCLAFQLVASVFGDFLVSQIMRLPTFGKIWDKFIHHIRQAALRDHRSVSTAALKCLDVSLGASKDASDDLIPVATIAWESAWHGVDEIGEAVGTRTSQPSAGSPHAIQPSPFTQESLEAFAAVIRTTYSLSGSTWDLDRIRRLLAILKGVLTYSRSPEYRPDVDTLTPVQAIVVHVIEDIKLDVKHSPSLVLCDLSEFATLAFVAAFDVEGFPQMSSPGSSDAQKRPPQKRVTYIALCKYSLSRLVDLFLRFKNQLDLYNDGTLEQALSAYSIPIKLKYDCPPPSKFGSDPPLWKTATISFLKIVRELARSLQSFGPAISGDRVEGIWRQALDVFRGGLLADCSAAENFPLEVQDAEEKFDLALIATLEIDVIPHLGDSRVPDAVIIRLATTLKNASRLRQVEDRIEDRAPIILDERVANIKASKVSEAPNQATDKHPTIPLGTTAPSLLLPRERFAYWTFDLLFLICAASTQDQASARQRVAALCLPSLLARCHSVLATFVVDEALRGGVPFPRVQEEELLYVLRKFQELQLWAGSLWAAFSGDPSTYSTSLPPIDSTLPPERLISDAAKRSTKAHLFHFYTLLYEIATAPRSPPSAWIVPSSAVTNQPRDKKATLKKEKKENGSKTDKASRARSSGGSNTFPVGIVGAEHEKESVPAVEVDSRQLAKELLRQIGKEMGVET